MQWVAVLQCLPGVRAPTDEQAEVERQALLRCSLAEHDWAVSEALVVSPDESRRVAEAKRIASAPASLRRTGSGFAMHLPWEAGELVRTTARALAPAQLGAASVSTAAAASPAVTAAGSTSPAPESESGRELSTGGLLSNHSSIGASVVSSPRSSRWSSHGEGLDAMAEALAAQEAALAAKHEAVTRERARLEQQLSHALGADSTEGWLVELGVPTAVADGATARAVVELEGCGSRREDRHSEDASALDGEHEHSPASDGEQTELEASAFDIGEDGSQLTATFSQMPGRQPSPVMGDGAGTIAPEQPTSPCLHVAAVGRSLGAADAGSGVDGEDMEA